MDDIEPLEFIDCRYNKNPLKLFLFKMKDSTTGADIFLISDREDKLIVPLFFADWRGIYGTQPKKENEK